MSGPTPQQIADAIVRVHKAFHEAWPWDEFNTADVPPLKKLAWAAQWTKAREGWRDTVESAVEELPLAASAADLEEIVRELIETFESSAHEFRVEVARMLDDDEDA